MSRWTVLLRDPAHPLSRPEAQEMSGPSYESVEDRAEALFDDAILVWISEGLDHDRALAEYLAANSVEAA